MLSFLTISIVLFSLKTSGPRQEEGDIVKRVKPLQKYQKRKMVVTEALLSICTVAFWSVLISAITYIPVATGTQSSMWTTQTLHTTPTFASDYPGPHQSVVISDINYDGAMDLVFAGPRPFALINVGKQSGSNEIDFSDPIPITTGATQDTTFTNVDIAFIPFYGEDSPCVLLSGGDAAAILVKLEVSTCGFWPPNSNCRGKSRVLWTDPSLSGSITARFAPDLGEEAFPAMVVATGSDVSIYQPQQGGFSTPANTFTTSEFTSVTALSIGSPGMEPGFIVHSSSGVSSKWFGS